MFDFLYLNGTPNNDIVVSDSGDIVLATTKKDLARQWVQVRLKTLLGSWFLDTTQGIDWIDLLSRRNTRVEIDSIVKKTIIETQYISEITSFSGEINNFTRKYAISFTVTVEDGEILTIDNLEI